MAIEVIIHIYILLLSIWICHEGM